MSDQIQVREPLPRTFLGTGEEERRDLEPASVVIFGASGDLTRRKLVPALHTLACGGLLPAASQVLGVARTPLSDEAFREQLFSGVQAYSRAKPGVCALWPMFEDRISYLAGDYDDPETYRRLKERLAQLDAQTAAWESEEAGRPAGARATASSTWPHRPTSTR